MTVGEQIETRRKEKGMLQEDLAAKLNITKQAICNWEKGRTEPNIGYLKQLAKILNCSVQDLTNDEYQETLTTQTTQEYTFLSEFRSVDDSTKEMVMRLMTFSKIAESAQGNEDPKA